MKIDPGLCMEIDIHPPGGFIAFTRAILPPDFASPATSVDDAKHKGEAAQEVLDVLTRMEAGEWNRICGKPVVPGLPVCWDHYDPEEHDHLLPDNWQPPQPC